jgi:hypothetical protein
MNKIQMSSIKTESIVGLMVTNPANEVGARANIAIAIAITIARINFLSVGFLSFQVFHF